jgi:hypothetical protein
MRFAGRSLIAGSLIVSTGILCLTVFTCAQTPPQPMPATQPPGTQVAPPQAAEWKTYSFPAEGFSASFPAQPIEQKQTVPTDAGTFELHTYIAASDVVALYVGVCDYGDAARGGDPDAILEGAKNGAVSNVHAHLVNSKKLSLGVYPGVELEAAADGAHLYGRIFLVGGILYQVFVALPSDRPYPDTIRFLDSFQVIPRSAP